MIVPRQNRRPRQRMAYLIDAIGIKTGKPGGAAEILAGTRRIPREDLIKALGLFLVLFLGPVILDRRFGETEVGGKWVLLFVLAGLSPPPSRHFLAADDELNKQPQREKLWIWGF